MLVVSLLSLLLDGFCFPYDYQTNQKKKKNPSDITIFKPAFGYINDYEVSINVRLVKEGIIILCVYFSILGKLQNMILTLLWMKGVLTDFLSKLSKPGCELPLKLHSCKLLSSPGKVRGRPLVYTTIHICAEPRLYSKCF